VVTKKLNKSAQVRKLLEKDFTADTIVKKVGCTKALVYQIYRKMRTESDKKVEAYFARPRVDEKIADALAQPLYTVRRNLNGKKTRKPKKIFTESKIGDNVGGLVLTDMGDGKVKWIRQPNATAVSEEIPAFLKSDPINPDHYKQGDIEAIDVIEAYQLNYHLGNVLKYVLRHSQKGNALEDLKKARWYLDREISKYD
jgi:hypothetical protein